MVTEEFSPSTQSPSEIKRMSRRQLFFNGRNLLLGIGTAALIDTGLIRVPEVLADEITMAEIPPTIMFHARENQKIILPELIDYLKEQDYTFVTYKEWYQAVEAGVLIEKPVIFTFDDITFVETSGNFQFYSEVAETLRAKEAKGVFGVITEPVVIGADGNEVQLTAQNERDWRVAREWVESGFIELATHTQSHPNLNNSSLKSQDYSREIAGSAALIERYTSQPVTTLITPFGSGVTLEGVIDARVLQACSETNIQFVVGIAGMRRPVVNTAENGQVIYGVGRVMPDDKQDSEALLRSLKGQVDWWSESNTNT